MYGLVNRAIEGFVCQKLGEDVWTRIRTRAGVDGAGFVSMERYDDAVTYGLVAAASAELGMDPAEILEAFGEYWTVYTIEEGYGDLLQMMGSTIDEFLDNLDSMHARIGGTMPGLVPPSFRRERQDDGSHLLFYSSSREGLAPMVIGLLKGLAQRFEIQLEIEHLGPDESGADRFLLREIG